MAQFPALDIWTDSWLADTNHLPRVDRDIYFHLIILIWRTPQCRVPNDIAWISRHLKCSPAEITILKSIISEFCNCDGNWLRQKRLSKEFKLALRRSKSASVNAKSRWNKDKVLSNGNATQHSGRNASTITATDTITVEESKTPLSPPIGGAVVEKKGFENGRRRTPNYSIRDSFQQAVDHIEARDKKVSGESGANDLKLLP